MGAIGRAVRWLIGRVVDLAITLTGLLFVLTVVNFFLFIGHCAYIGGDALNGHQDGGRFFVRSHGDITEVPELTWMLNRDHAFFTLGTFFALAVLHGLAALIRFLCRRMGWPVPAARNSAKNTCG